MTRDHIVHAASCYAAGEITKSRIERGRRAFIAGADWRIRVAWHDASKEKPNMWMLLLRKDRDGGYDLGFEIKDDTVSWAYVRDLIE